MVKASCPPRIRLETNMTVLPSGDQTGPCAPYGSTSSRDITPRPMSRSQMVWRPVDASVFSTVSQRSSSERAAGAIVPGETALIADGAVHEHAAGGSRKAGEAGSRVHTDAAHDLPRLA